ncbi:MAG: hypothetical protein V1858_00715 [Candidatus Gottesmanbacteria bacterium]
MVKEGSPVSPESIKYQDLYESLLSAAIACKKGMSLPAYRDYLIGTWAIVQLLEGKELTLADIQVQDVSYDQAVGIMMKVRSRVWADTNYTKRLEGYFKPVPDHTKKGLKHFYIEEVNR